jgi:hypothetical protein
MNVRYSVKNEVTAEMAAVQRVFDGQVWLGNMARALERLFRQHIAALPANRLGRTTNFWQRAARATHAEPTERGVAVTVSQVGFRQRFFGGVIKPVNKEWLAIPARSEFYGARARQFTGLRFHLFKSGAAALVIEKGGAEKVTSLGATRYVGGKKSAGMVAFWLVKEVNQAGDPSIIPDAKSVVATCVEATRRMVELAKRKRKR